MKLIKVYSMQSIEVANLLISKQPYAVDINRGFAREDFKFAYDWLCNKMREKGIRLGEDEYPIWGHTRVSDFMHYVLKGQALLKTYVPKDQILVSCLSKWSGVLCKFYTYHSWEADLIDWNDPKRERVEDIKEIEKTWDKCLSFIEEQQLTFPIAEARGWKKICEWE